MTLKAEKRPLLDVPVSQISIGDRGREDLGNLEELVNDIRENDLIQPIALKSQPDGYSLIAGERRLKACLELERETIPAVIYPEDTPELKCMIIELAENTKRKQMTPEEEAKTALRIHKMGVDLEGEAKPSNNFEGWSLSKTADVLGIKKKWAGVLVQNALAYEANLPGIDKAKTSSDVNKLVRRFKKETIKKTESVRVRKKIEAKPEEGRRKELLDSYIVLPPKSEDLLQNGFFELARDIPDNSADLIELDSPYSQGLNEQSTVGTKKFKTSVGSVTMEEYNDLPPEIFPQWCTKMYSECYRILKPGRWFLVWFAGEPWQEKIFQWLLDVEFKGKRIGGYWIKSIGQTMHPDRAMASCVERFYYVAKGPARINREGRNNSFIYPGCPVPKAHPTERPIEMMTDIISTFTPEGGHIIVPCLGSGNTILAANNHNCSAVGAEIVEDYKTEFILKVNSQELSNFHSYKKPSDMLNIATVQYPDGSRYEVHPDNVEKELSKGAKLVR